MRRLACLHHKAARAIGILHFDSSRYFIQISLTDPDIPSMGPIKRDDHDSSRFTVPTPRPHLVVAFQKPKPHQLHSRRAILMHNQPA
jgi:hypothetical protein